jgi:hypothetical protein
LVSKICCCGGRKQAKQERKQLGMTKSQKDVGKSVTGSQIELPNLKPALDKS